MLELLLNSPILLLFCVGVLGLLIGSFFNVAIHRIPNMLMAEWHSQCKEFLSEHPEVKTPEKYNLFFPRSHCPSCKQMISGWWNIPVFSYLFLGGKCRNCQAKIPLRYPLVELATAILAVFIVYYLGITWQAAAALVFTGILLILIFIDLDQQLLPDGLTLGLLWIGLFCSVFNLFCSAHEAIIGAIVGYSSLWLVATAFKICTGREGMGYGDFKLFAALGAWLGWQQLPFVILASSLVGAIVGISLMAFKKHQRGTPIPFGPYLAVAGWISLFWAEDLTQAYLNLFI